MFRTKPVRTKRYFGQWVVGRRLRERLAGGFADPTSFTDTSAKCPCCQQYSLTYDWPRDAFKCNIYGAIITAEQLSQVTQS